MHICLLEGLRGVTGTEEELKSLIRYADGCGFIWDVLEGRYLLARLLLSRGAREPAKTLLERVQSSAAEHGHELILHDARELLAGI